MEKRVAHFIRKDSQLTKSFVQNQIIKHVKYKPAVIFRYHSNKNDAGFAEFNRDDIPILNLASDKNIDLNLRYLKRISKKDVKKILDYLDNNDVSILHFHIGSDACIYSDIMRLSQKPSVVSFYGYDASSFRYFLWGYGGYLLKKRLFPYVSKVLVMSPDMKNDLLQIGCPEDKIIVHYYGTDVKKFIQKKNYTENEDVTLIIISCLDPQKGHRYMLESLMLVHQQNKKIKLKIFGTGSIEKEIKKIINKNNMNSYVSLNGKLTYGSKEHLNELYEADIFIHPSVQAKNGSKEGIPGAIVEAMASGLPVISTYHAGIPYIINNMETGILISEWDVNGLSESIKLLINDVKLRTKLGKAGQAYATENLDLDVKEIELESIYNNLLK